MNPKFVEEDIFAHVYAETFMKHCTNFSPDHQRVAGEQSERVAAAAVQALVDVYARREAKNVIPEPAPDSALEAALKDAAAEIAAQAEAPGAITS